MSGWKRLAVPIKDQDLDELAAGDKVLLSGVVFSARDAAHSRLTSMLENDQELPMDLRGAVIYYVGPCPPKPGSPVGPAGPTTSGRMDVYTPPLLEAGVKGMIGKGERAQSVVDSIKKNNAVYFVTIGGAGAYLSQRIRDCRIIAFPELGAEAVHRMELVDFPAFVGIDSTGKTIFDDFKEQGDGTHAKD